MIVDKMANMHIYEKTIPQIKEIIPILDQAKDMEVGTYMYPWGKVMIQEATPDIWERENLNPTENSLMFSVCWMEKS